MAAQTRSYPFGLRERPWSITALRDKDQYTAIRQWISVVLYTQEFEVGMIQGPRLRPLDYPAITPPSPRQTSPTTSLTSLFNVEIWLNRETIEFQRDFCVCDSYLIIDDRPTCEPSGSAKREEVDKMPAWLGGQGSYHWASGTKLFLRNMEDW